MHCPNDNNGKTSTTTAEEEGPFAQGISMHLHKDEELRILTGGATYVHPHISTVTYLTNLGSPTMITNCRVHPLEGSWIVPYDDHDDNDDTTPEGFVSWPVPRASLCRLMGATSTQLPATSWSREGFHSKFNFQSKTRIPNGTKYKLKGIDE